MSMWRPFTQMKNSPIPPKVIKGQGLYLHLEDGTKLMDMISSWWVTLHGHGREEIAKAIYQQARDLEQVIFANFTHNPAEKLIKNLKEILPDSLEHFFFSDNGSTAVEVAIKMCIQYWSNLGSKRDKFLAFTGAYHGDTLGAMSVNSPSCFTSPFTKQLFSVTHIPYPDTWEDDNDIKTKEDLSIETLVEILENSPNTYAGIIIEPLIQGAGGMNMCRKEFLQSLRKITTKYDIPLIYDEVMTGFGRTGDFFACNKTDTTPDIICLSKGITGGFLPLSLTVATKKIYDAFYSDDQNKTFLHGHSYTANPIACSAALSSLEILKKEMAFSQIEKWHKKHILPFKKHPRVEKIRICGTIAAMNIRPLDKEDRGYFSSIGKKVQESCLQEGIFLRPLGDVIYLLPPYCIKEKELSFVYEKILEALNTIEY